jgi:hypothetical protein
MQGGSLVGVSNGRLSGGFVSRSYDVVVKAIWKETIESRVLRVLNAGGYG